MNVDGAIGIGYTDKVFEVTNNFSSASLSVPLKKTINGQNQASSSQFGFTLTLTEAPKGASVYSDQACTSANAVTTAAATIAGSGTTNVNTVYFNTMGTYKFTLAEDPLSVNQTNSGFTKDNTVYNITVEIGNDSSKGLVVTSATYESEDGTKFGDLQKQDVPYFNNILELNSAVVTLEATKKLTLTSGSRDSMEEGEFTFKVVEDGEVITTGKVKADTDNDNVSAVEFTPFEYGADDLGSHILTIYEVQGNDLTISYSDVVFFAVVKVDAPAEGSAQLTYSVTYSTQFAKNLDDQGKPVFTNKYTPISTTGVPTEFVPFAMMAVIAGGVGAVVTVRKWKRRIARS
jgi:hypothetical protein